MKRISRFNVLLVCALSTEVASAEFPLPNKIVPFTEGGRVYVHEFEYRSNTGAVYVTYCPALSSLSFETQIYEAWWKLLPHYIYNANCQTYKYIVETFTWVPSWESYWNYYLSPWYSLNELVRTNSDIYYTVGWPTLNFGTQYGNLGAITPGQKILSKNWDFEWNEPYIPTHLTFPIPTETAYTAAVTSMMDHDMTAPYQENGEVLSFEGEIGDSNPNDDCYAKADNTEFGITINYVGTVATGGATRLCYDGHPGYDYWATANTEIHSPEFGILCPMLEEDEFVGNLWRDPVECPYPDILTQGFIQGTNPWVSFHAFYIYHEGRWINGVRNDYITKFLHNNSLESNIQSDIEMQGYSYVSKNELVAYSGDIGSSGSYHIHLEVFKKNGEAWERVDPYGTGLEDTLWELQCE